MSYFRDSQGKKVFVAKSIAAQQCSCCGSITLVLYDDDGNERAIASVDVGILPKLEATAIAEAAGAPPRHKH